MSLTIGTEVEFQETMTRRPLRGIITDCRDGQVEIKTPDGKMHSRVVKRVVPVRAGLPKPDIKARFKYLRQVVAMVANNHTVSAIISGPGGLGKTHTVTETLAVHGYKKNVDYQLVNGFTSARGLYETLYRNNGLLTVFDDCDSALENNISASILKGALDSNPIRSISWLVKAPAKSNGIPMSFEYDGRIIFVTNKLIYELDGPLRTRSLVIDLQMTREEILEWLNHALPDFRGYSMADKTTALTFIRSISEDVRELSLRTLIRVLQMMKANPYDWQGLAANTITK